MFLECDCLKYLGLCFCAYLALRVLCPLWSLVNIYFLGSYPNFKKYGSWSVVTGATDGIGLAFAKKLAKFGQNIVLISRSKDKLNAVAEEIQSKFNVKTLVIAADFTDPDIYEAIFAELRDLDIGVLINNVGISFEYPEYFLDIPDLPGAIDKMIAVNIRSTVKMTEYVLPGMVSRKSGVILNLSSGAAVKPTPLLSLYSASKQFVDCFSKTLNAEYAKQGVIIQSIVPFYVTTKLSKIRRSSMLVPNPDTFVSSTLKTIGKAKRSYGYFAHAIEGTMFSMIPESLYMMASKRLNNSIRIRALKKKNQKKE
ncbi:very-long-chain 3-oxoacyl-CoA reductase-like [Clavelina lepadiformis]|uniref:very-long-chain 3-oxoacyl-CoA reductase-like n=1 Tax=Clavelina lepadiformis TaxID=159417 RepID=UPI00404193E0